MRKSGMNLLLLVMVMFGALAPMLIAPGALSADELPVSAMRPDAIKLSSKYPSATGPADTTFMFQVEMLYRLVDTDYQQAVADTGKLQSRVFGFELSGPEGWEFFVAESSWKLDSRIAAMQLRALGVPQTLVVVARAPWWTSIEPGEYPIELNVTAGDIGDSLTLKAVVTAWYGLEASTTTDRLNTKTTAGSPAYVDVKVVNTGSAPLNKVSVSSTKPSGIANEQWTVRFEPDVIKDLAPGEQQQVRAAITPPEKAISGDYFVTLSLASEPALSDFNPSLEIRVSIETRPTWVVIGVAVVVLAFGALMYAFYILRQR
jgi:uncharacterized membrane protein